jgi:hypothetical protein
MQNFKKIKRTSIFSSSSLHAFAFASEFKYDVYEYFLPESDCTEEQFQLAYQLFTSVDDLTATAYHVTSLAANTTAFRLAAYPAAGRILGLVVSQPETNKSAALYGLAHAYGCRLVAEWPRGCEELYSTYTWLVCAAGIFLGSFLALMGHRFFKCSQLIFGFYLGAVVAYVAIAASFELDDILVLGLAGLCGLATSVGTLAIWWFLGIPVISVLLPLLEVGFLTACAFMALPVKLSAAFATDSTYWLTFACIALLPTILLIAFTQKASIISCAVVGMVTVVYCLDYYTRSSLKYVVIDVIRRAVVPDFGTVILAGPPFEKTDLFLVTCLLAGILLGLVCQLVLERTKPPFPPSPYQLYRWHRIPLTDEDGGDGSTAGRAGEPPSPVAAARTAQSGPPAPVPVVGYILRHHGGSASPRASAGRSTVGGLQVKK